MVETGADAVKAALKVPFDLILMDVHMPLRDGVTATCTLRRSGCATPVVTKPIRHNALLNFLAWLSSPRSEWAGVGVVEGVPGVCSG